DIDIDYEEDHITIKVKKNKIFSNENSMVAVFQEGSSFQKSFYVPNIESNRIKAVYNADVIIIYLKKSHLVEKVTTIIDVDNFTNADSFIEVGNFNEISDKDKSTELYNQRYIE
ncbi:Hsp20 family protein, partial [Clostridium perfringens]